MGSPTPPPALRSASKWWMGARPRTLGAAIGPVLVGTAAAAAEGDVIAWRAGAALLVALGLQIGTNFANDYSDGVRGTDTDRVGPPRLTASGLASPAAVRNAAALSFLVAALAGLALAVAVDLRLLAVGAAAIAAGVLYTGGPKPYGYAGLGELSVLLFFGFVATVGSAYVHLETVTGLAVAAAVPVGLLACVLLMVNNLRDLATDRAAGKRTLAVRLGDSATRMLLMIVLMASFAAVAFLGLAHPLALAALAAIPLALRLATTVVRATSPRDLLPALGVAGRLHQVVSALLAAGLWLS